MDTMHTYWGAEMGLGMWIFWILFIAAIVILIRMMFGTRSGASPPANGPPTDSQDNALEILKRRYASGEIDTDEYRSMKKVLEDLSEKTG